MADEHGIIAVADLRRAGVDGHTVRSLVKAGELTFLARGWYACGSPAGADERHVLTTRALLRAHEDRAVAGHHSALLLSACPRTERTCRRSGSTVGRPDVRAPARVSGSAAPSRWMLSASRR
jgi:hypothetical protein